MVREELDRYMQKKKKNETGLPTYTIHQNKLKMEKKKDLNISHDTINLQENIDRKISDIPHSDIFAHVFPRAREIKGKINK